MLASSNADHNFIGVTVLGEIFSWPEALTEILLQKFEQPYDYLLINFVKPYVNHFKGSACDAEWLSEPIKRCSII